MDSTRSAVYRGDHISDVQHRSAQSDFSQDFVGSAHRLEHQFENRYNALRSEYENRIMRLSEVIESTCAKLFSDELLNELKNDTTSAAFIPAHLSEVIGNALNNERERYVNDLVHKVAELEIDNSRLKANLGKEVESAVAIKQSSSSMNSTVASLTETLQNLERNYAEYLERTEIELKGLRATNEELALREKQLSNKVEILKHELSERSQHCDIMKAQLRAKDRDLSTLERSFEDNARELSLIEGMEKQEQMRKRDLKEQLTAVTAERNALYDENQQLRAKWQYASDELDRYYTSAAQKDAEDAQNKQRIAELMSQVEEMLTQEADESNAAISAVHDKMKTFRLKMSTELQREKRFSAALQEELQFAKTARDESLREQNRLAEHDAHLREQLASEQQRGAALQHQLQEEVQAVTALKVKLADAQAHVSHCEHQLRDYDRLKSLETRLIEERAEIKSEKSKDSEQQHVDKRMEAYKMHYENELAELRKQLKNAYSFDKSGKNVDPSEVSYKNTIQSWVQENARLKQRHTAELAALATRLKGEYEELVGHLQSKLEEAAENIDKLKGMVRDSKATIRAQDQRIEKLVVEGHAMKQSLDNALTSASPSAAPAWNNANARRGSVQSSSSFGTAGTATPPLRRSTLAPGLSPAATAKEVQSHRVAVLQRSLSAPRAENVRTADASSLAVPMQRDATRGPASSANSSRRSSTSVLGTSRLIHPDVSFTQAESSVVEDTSFAHAQLTSARDEATTAKRAASAANEELARLRGELIRVQRESAEFESTVRDLQAQLSVAKPTRSASVARIPAGESWDKAMDQSLLNAKTEEINNLRNQVRDLQTQVSAAKSTRTTASVASMPLTEPRDKGSHISLLNAKTDEINNLRNQVRELQRSAAERAEESELVINGLRRDYDALEEKLAALHEDENRSRVISDDASTAFSSADSSDVSVQVRSVAASDKQSVKFDTSAYEASMQQMEESLLHQAELSRISAQELTEERLRTRDMRKREVKLFQLLTTVEQTYRAEIHKLRQDLIDVRAAVQSFGPVAQVEVRRTVSALSGHLDRIFHHNEQKMKEDVRQVQVALSSAHAEEMNALEARFVQQIELQATMHTLELEQQHSELVMKAESALGLAGSIADSESLDDSLDMAATTIKSHSRQRNVSFASEASDARSRHSQDSLLQRRTSTSSSGQRRSSWSSEQSALPAYESVATGVLEALVVEDMLDKAGSQQILALAKAHQEPSFAAQAAAKSILSGYLEKFVNNLHNRYAKASAATTKGGASAQASDTGGGSGASSSASYKYSSGSDYAVFFD